MDYEYVCGEKYNPMYGFSWDWPEDEDGTDSRGYHEEEPDDPPEWDEDPWYAETEDYWDWQEYDKDTPDAAF